MTLEQFLSRLRTKLLDYLHQCPDDQRRAILTAFDNSVDYVMRDVFADLELRFPRPPE